MGELPRPGADTYIGYDKDGTKWLLAWSAEGAKGEWSALAWITKDGRRLPTVRRAVEVGVVRFSPA